MGPNRVAALAVLLVACVESAPATPAASTAPAAAARPGDGARLAAIARDLDETDSTGTRAGELFEERGEILERRGELEAAARAYFAASRAYGQSPEATSMPVVRSDRAK